MLSLEANCVSLDNISCVAQLSSILKGVWLAEPNCLTPDSMSAVFEFCDLFKHSEISNFI